MPIPETDVEETRRAVAAIAVVGKVDGYDVIRRSSAMQVVQMREKYTETLVNALWKACADDASHVEAYIKSQRDY